MMRYHQKTTAAQIEDKTWVQEKQCFSCVNSGRVFHDDLGRRESRPSLNLTPVDNCHQSARYHAAMDAATKPTFYAYIAAAACCLGIAPFASKAGLNEGADPVLLALLITTLAVLGALVVVLINQPELPSIRDSKRVYAHLLAIGAFGSGAVTLLGILAMTETSATNRSLFQAMYPMATAICARLILGEQLRMVSYVTILVMCAGLYLTNSGSGGTEFGKAFWMLAATLPLIGLADVFAKKSLSDVEPQVVALFRLGFGALFLLLALPFMQADGWSQTLGVWQWILLAAAMKVGGLVTLYRAMDKTKASLVAGFIALAPVVTLGAEWVFFDSSFETLQLVGVLLVVCGAIWLARVSGDKTEE